MIAWANDIDWLGEHLPPSPVVEWCARFPDYTSTVRGQRVSLVEWFFKWAHLPLTHIHLRNQSETRSEATYVTRNVAPYLYFVLPRCRNVVSLDLAGLLDLAAIFELATSSTKLESLRISSMNVPFLSIQIVRQAIQWLTSTRVRMFWFSKWTWDPTVDPSLQNAFLAALFQCPTMINLSLTYCNLSQLNSEACTTLSTSLEILTLTSCQLSSSCLVGLAHGLPKSNVVQLHLEGMDEADPATRHASFQHVLAAVAHSKVTTLTLERCIDNDTVVYIGPWLAQTQLRDVSFVENGVMDSGAVALAKVLQGNTSIRRLNLDANNLTVQGVVALLEGNSIRSVPLEELGVAFNNIYLDEDKAMLRARAHRLSTIRFD
ncbi:Aste57867_22648 [Aphanomyces stellatus]|nr:hypothetical protein As57867_022578 [Aphanomyces stellatus]VFT99302.1 Aste57867_22648 [Aphanomyces stellatus]